MGRRSVRLVCLLATTVVAFACGGADERPTAGPEASVPHLAPGPAEALPATEQAFLEALAPMPFEAVRVHYEVTGPAGMHGRLRIDARPGGFRREQWELSLPAAGDEPLPVTGAMVVTPEASWTDAVQGAPLVHRSALQPLAQAYRKLRPELQTLVMYQLRRWHTALGDARRELPGAVETILGRTCLRTHVAGHRLCVWEETGLPLLYQSDAFVVQAVEIEIAPELEPDAFALPEDAQPALDAPARFDADAAIARLAGGDFAQLALWLQPGLRPPIFGS